MSERSYSVCEVWSTDLQTYVVRLKDRFEMQEEK